VTVGRYVSFGILLVIKALTLIFYRRDGKALDGGPIPGRPWKDIRLICFLNHTSLYEPVFAALVPNRFMWQIASRAVVPVAEITLRRPVIGAFFRLLIPHPVSITREPDHTWDAVLRKIDDHSMVIILPEGRMRRGNGLDRDGKPMTARGGVADILRTIDSGQMLMAYSGGLHHVQIPGQHFPRLFRTIRMRFELLDIAEYRAEMLRLAGGGSLKNVVKEDLDRRRDLYSPMTPESTRQPSPEDLTRLKPPRAAPGPPATSV
jgi:1-acyl-sn-glycerol-3-phosphate acyltransferase